MVELGWDAAMGVETEQMVETNREISKTSGWQGTGSVEIQIEQGAERIARNKDLATKP